MTNVIVHCSDSSWGNASEITKWHLKRGWATIGYHYVILNGRLSPFKMHSYYDGHIETGRALDDDKDMELDEKGAHAFGYNMAVGICLIGLSGTFTDAQMRSLGHLIRRLKKQFGEIEILQHSDVDPVNKPHCAGLSSGQMRVLRIDYDVH
jgi:N-acetylmuramoyl-L-alanine amidase